MVLIFSMPKTAKVRDMRLSLAVSLALDSADGGQDIVLAEGQAKLIAGRIGIRPAKRRPETAPRSIFRPARAVAGCDLAAA
jgi:hypothetical protein